MCELRPALLQQHRPAAFHVHHAAHAALALAKAHWDSGERAANQHEQKEDRCETDFHVKVTVKKRLIACQDSLQPRRLRQQTKGDANRRTAMTVPVEIAQKSGHIPERCGF